MKVGKYTKIQEKELISDKGTKIKHLFYLICFILLFIYLFVCLVFSAVLVYEFLTERVYK